MTARSASLLATRRGKLLLHGDRDRRCPGRRHHRRQRRRLRGQGRARRRAAVRFPAAGVPLSGWRSSPPLLPRVPARCSPPTPRAMPRSPRASTAPCWPAPSSCSPPPSSRCAPPTATANPPPNPAALPPPPARFLRRNWPGNPCPRYRAGEPQSCAHPLSRSTRRPRSRPKARPQRTKTSRELRPRRSKRGSRRPRPLAEIL